MAVLLCIPSLLFWGAFNLHIDSKIQREKNQIKNELSINLQNLAYSSAPERFFQKKFEQLFTQIKGLHIETTAISAIIDEFKNRWGSGMLDIYLFDGSNKALDISNARKGHELFFSYINKSYDFIEVSAKDLREIGKNLPSPELILSRTRNQNNRVVRLGNPDNFTYCYFNHENIHPERISGILIFVHANNLEHSDIIKNTIQEHKRKNYGFVTSDDYSMLPQIIEQMDSDQLINYFLRYPRNTFILDDIIISLKRIDEYRLLVGAKAKPTEPLVLKLLLLLTYITCGLIFAVFSFKATVLHSKYDFNIRHRLTFLLAVCYAIPLIATTFLGVQYLNQLKQSLLAKQQHFNYRRLAEIDSSFNRFLTARLIDLRDFSNILQKNVDNKCILKERLRDKYNSFKVDSLHLMASDSTIIYTEDLMTAEVRRHYNESEAKKQLILKSWQARHANLSDSHIKALFSEPEENGLAAPPALGANHRGFLRLFSSASHSAIDTYNRSMGFTRPSHRSATDLAIDTFIESGTQSIFQAAKTNIGKFIYMRGVNEIMLGFVDIIPGPEGDAWYSLLILIDLINYQRQFFESFFSEISLKADIFNRISPAEDIRAISTHNYGVNFPSILEFKKFESIIKRSENDFKTFSAIMELDGEMKLVSVLKGAYLEQYLLLKIIPISEIDNIYNQRLYSMSAALGILLIIGFLVTKTGYFLFIQPFKEITEGVKALAEHKYDHKIIIESKNEFAVLADAFNESANTISQLAIAQKIRSELYPAEEFRCGSYIITTSNYSSRVILSDFYDYIALKQGTYAIILAEVSGNDISAAYITTMLKTAFTLLCPDFPFSPENILAKLNTILLPYHQKGHMTTCMIGILDPTNDKITIANAGQSYPVLINHKSKQAKYLPMPSTPLGISPKTVFIKHEFDLENSTMILYSDGAVNLSDKSGNAVGHENFLNIVKLVAKNKDSRNVSKGIINKLNALSTNFPWRDDITIMTIQNRIL